MSTVCIAQARRRSTRLPDKILKDLNGFRGLTHVLERCKDIPGVGNVVCAGVDDPFEAPIVDIAKASDVDVFQGDEHDVLGRFYGALEGQSGDWVMRVTSDCPLLEPELCGSLISIVQDLDMDYGALTTVPHGLDCEIIRREILEEAHHRAKRRSEREHVTAWAVTNPALKRLTLGVMDGWIYRKTHRWVLDYPEDYQLLLRIFADMEITPNNRPSWRNVLSYAEETPAQDRENIHHIAGWQKKWHDTMADSKKSHKTEESPVPLYILDPDKPGQTIRYR